MNYIFVVALRSEALSHRDSWRPIYCLGQSRTWLPLCRAWHRMRRWPQIYPSRKRYRKCPRRNPRIFISLPLRGCASLHPPPTSPSRSRGQPGKFLLAARRSFPCRWGKWSGCVLWIRTPRERFVLWYKCFHSRIQEIETCLEIGHLEARLELAGRVEDPEEAQAETSSPVSQGGEGDSRARAVPCRRQKSWGGF